MSGGFDESTECAVRRQGSCNVEVRFISSGREQVFVVTQVPDSCTGAGVVMCPPLFVDFLRNYRRIVSLADALAAQGIAVQRFHYRGTGQSDGDAEAVTFDSMCADAVAAGDFLRERAGISRIGYFGLRFGALVAANIATSTEPLAFWQPAVSGHMLFREAARARRMSQMRQGADTAAQGDVASEIAANGRADLLGYSLGRPLFESVEGLTLAHELHAPRPVFLASLGRPLPAYEAIAIDWRASGCDVTQHYVDANEETKDAWWFLEDRAPIPHEMIEATTAWLSRRLARDAA